MLSGNTFIGGNQEDLARLETGDKRLLGCKLQILKCNLGRIDVIGAVEDRGLNTSWSLRVRNILGSNYRNQLLRVIWNNLTDLGPVGQMGTRFK